MVHRVFTFAAALSLLMFLATAGLWVISYRTGECVEIHFERQQSLWLVFSRQVSFRGVISIEFASDHAHTVSDFGTIRFFGGSRVIYRHDWTEPLTGPAVGSLRFSAKRYHFGFMDSREIDTATPHWLVVIAFSILPAVKAKQLRSSRQGNRCLFCAYDLTGNTSGVCPECGMAIETTAGA
ncbi:MAG TPA: hypothetical protein VIM11_27540 [Tepidisphaeraceae bacterium]|jgi:hypothetical protein